MSGARSGAGVVRAVAGGVQILVKAVPGASRNQIVGVLGERLKVKVAAHPEGGKANAAIEKLLAEAIGVAAREVSVVSGANGAEKAVMVDGVTVEGVRAALGLG